MNATELFRAALARVKPSPPRCCVCGRRIKDSEGYGHSKHPRRFWCERHATPPPTFWQLQAARVARFITPHARP